MYRVEYNILNGFIDNPIDIKNTMPTAMGGIPRTHGCYLVDK
jgi:hypothetical protein